MLARRASFPQKWIPVLRPEFAPLFREHFLRQTGFHFAGKCAYPGDIMAAEIRLFPCLTDNLGYLIHDPATKATASIDAPEAAPIIKELVREVWTMNYNLVSQQHGDKFRGTTQLIRD